MHPDAGHRGQRVLYRLNILRAKEAGSHLLGPPWARMGRELPLSEPLAGPEREQRSEVIDDAVGRGLRDAEVRSELAQRQVGTRVGGDQRESVFQRQAPWSAPPYCVRSFAPKHGHQLAETARTQPGERRYPGRFRCRGHSSHVVITAFPARLGRNMRQTPGMKAGSTPKAVIPSRTELLNCWISARRTSQATGEDQKSGGWREPTHQPSPEHTMRISALLLGSLCGIAGYFARAGHYRLPFRILVPAVALVETSMRLSAEADAQEALVGATWSVTRILAVAAILLLVGVSALEARKQRSAGRPCSCPCSSELKIHLTADGNHRPPGFVLSAGKPETQRRPCRAASFVAAQ